MVDDDVLAALYELTTLAPLYNPATGEERVIADETAHTLGLCG